LSRKGLNFEGVFLLAPLGKRPGVATRGCKPPRQSQQSHIQWAIQGFPADLANEEGAIRSAPFRHLSGDLSARWKVLCVVPRVRTLRVRQYVLYVYVHSSSQQQRCFARGKENRWEQSIPIGAAQMVGGCGEREDLSGAIL